MSRAPGCEEASGLAATIFIKGGREYAPKAGSLIYSALQIRVRAFIRGNHHGMTVQETVFR